MMLKMRGKLILIIIAGLFSQILVGCKKYDYDFKKYLNHEEIVYPGVILNPGYHAGNLRTQLYWSPNSDPNVTSYRVYWNNKADSMVVPITQPVTPSDLITVVIPDLNEYVYSFTVVSFDDQGNRSVNKEINNVRVYGPAYEATLLNRAYDGENLYEFLPDGELKLNFNKRDTMNVSTTIHYTNVLGEETKVDLDPEDNSIVIGDFKSGSAITYRSSYQPELESFDTFYVSQLAEFPQIVKITEFDKTLFEPMLLPGDNDQNYGWVLSNLWNDQYYKSDSDNPDEGFHTAGTGLPQSFTFDMGQLGKIDNFRLWQRDNALYNIGNPKVFEVWGSATEPDPDGSWDNWIKLGTFTSVKPSGLPGNDINDVDRTFARAGEKFTMPADTPPVEYIRFNILETWGGVDYIHLTELTFFKVE